MTIIAYVYANVEARASKKPLGGSGFPKTVHLGEEMFSDPQLGGLVEQVKQQAAWPILMSHPSMLVGDPPKQKTDDDGNPIFEEDGTTPVMEPDTRTNFFTAGKFVDV